MIARHRLGASAVDIAVQIDVDAWRERLPDVEERVKEAARAALDSARRSMGQAELCVVLADDTTVRDLNRHYRGKDKPTNVLSFPQDGDGEPDAETLASEPGMPILLGDVILAYETVAAEARDQNKSISDHLAHLVVHGVLHLLGYDHQSEDDAQAMERLETRILGGLGVADPYAQA